jgi:hypothetical protein
MGFDANIEDNQELLLIKISGPLVGKFFSFLIIEK